MTDTRFDLPANLPGSPASPDSQDPQAVRRAAFASTKRLVVKVGSRLLAESPAARPAILADDVACTHAAAIAQVDKDHRGREKASDHAPVWVTLR